VDVALYAYGDGMDQDRYEDLLARNWTDHSDVQAPTCCFEDAEDGSVHGIKHLMSGMARVIVYQVADVSNAAAPDMTVTHVLSYYEGEGQNGAPQGFGRQIRDLRPAADVQDNFIGYLAADGTVAGRYVYFNNFELVHQGRGADGSELHEAPAESFEFDEFADPAAAA